MKKFTYLLFLAIGVTACSVESMDSNENLLVVDAKATVNLAHDPMGFYTGNNTLKGTVSVWNDCDNLFVQLTRLNGHTPDDIKLGIFPEGTLPNENGVSGQLGYDLSNADNFLWTFNIAGENYDVESSLNIFFGWGNEWIGTQVLGDKNNAPNYHIFTFDLSGCEEVEETDCPSGYMFGDTEFIDLDETAKNWGWGHEFNMEAGETERKYIQHKFDELGYIEITLNANGSVTITEGSDVTVTHRYVADARPTDTAPGTFNKTGNLGDENRDGKFWVMIKAEVCK